jgi:hypothetical protein
LSGHQVRLILVIGIIALAATIGIVYAILEFTQTVPSIPVNQLSPGCANVNNETPATSTAETLFLDCGAPGLPVAAFSSVAVSATPTFTLPSPYSALYIYEGPGSQSCAGVTSQSAPFNAPLVSGTSVSLVAGSYSYCLTYFGATLGQTLPTFTISWSVP